MASPKSPNYPDVLGYVTDIRRYGAGAVQAGLAIRPQVVRAGQPFEVILLLQNSVDEQVSVSVSLELPEKDAAGAKGHFAAPKDHLAITLAPAEVGYVVLPVVTKMDTAPGKNYSLNVTIDTKSKTKKPRTIRDADGGGRFNPASIPARSRKQLESLKKLTFSAEKQGGRFKSTGVKAPFGVMKGKPGKKVKLKPGWVSLWTLGKQRDAGPLLDKFGDILLSKIFPGLKREFMYPPLLEKTLTRFEEVGYPLTEVEASTIARLLALILEFAFSGEQVNQGEKPAGVYHVASSLSSKRKAGGDAEGRSLPRWVVIFLQAMARDERFIAVPPNRTIPTVAYDSLLHDALIYAFQLVQIKTGEDLLSPEEIGAYAERVMKIFANNGEMTFEDTYLPLVMGGIIITPLMVFEGERLPVIFQGMVNMIIDRYDEEDELNEDIFRLAERILDAPLKQYGVLDGGR